MNVIYKQNEAQTNETVAKLVLWLLGFVVTISVFGWVGIFDVDNKLINIFLVASILPLSVPVILVKLLHMNGRWIKYVLITCVSLVTGIAYVVFTFQAVMIFVVTSILATFYLDKRLMYYTGIVTCIVIAVAHGISGVYLFQPWIEPFTEMHMILLYGAIPRMMQYLCCTIFLSMLCQRFLGFLDGCYVLIEEEREKQSNEEMKTERGELERVLCELTEREKEVFSLLVQGHTNAQIANQLCLSMGTVKNYVSNIYDKVELRDRTALVLKYSPFYNSYDQSHTN